MGVKFENCPIEKNITQYTLNLSKFECIFGKPKFDSQKLIQAGARTLLYFFVFVLAVFFILVLSLSSNFQTFKDLEPGFLIILVIFAAMALIAALAFFEVIYRKVKSNFNDKSRNIVKKAFILYFLLFLLIMVMYIFTGFYKLAFLSFMVMMYLFIVARTTKKLFWSTTGEQSRVFAKQKKL